MQNRPAAGIGEKRISKIRGAADSPPDRVAYSTMDIPRLAIGFQTRWVDALYCSQANIGPISRQRCTKRRHAIGWPAACLREIVNNVRDPKAWQRVVSLPFPTRGMMRGGDWMGEPPKEKRQQERQRIALRNNSNCGTKNKTPN